MYGFNEYTNAFKKGLNYVLYSDYEKRVEPTLDKGNIESIGFNDGYIYGEYCERTGQTMSISQEQLIAVINKAYSRAIDTYREYENKYIRYKSGFYEGKENAFLKYKTEDETFNVIPEVDEKDLYSIGYYDGYCYSLNKTLNEDAINNELEENITSKPLEVITRTYFKESLPKYEKSISNCTNQQK
jgi:hypothetical protein